MRRRFMGLLSGAAVLAVGATVALAIVILSQNQDIPASPISTSGDYQINHTFTTPTDPGIWPGLTDIVPGAGTAGKVRIESELAADLYPTLISFTATNDNADLADAISVRVIRLLTSSSSFDTPNCPPTLNPDGSPTSFPVSVGAHLLEMYFGPLSGMAGAIENLGFVTGAAFDEYPIELCYDIVWMEDSGGILFELSGQTINTTLHFVVDEGVDADGDGFGPGPAGEDCDDTDPLVNPLATEIPANSVDDDCDGEVDEA